MTNISIHYSGEIVTKKDAKELSLTRYFTGKPCKHGHIAQRYIRGQCCFCSYLNVMKISSENREKYSQKSRNYYKANKKNQLAKSKIYREKNKKQILEKRKEYRQNNKQMIRANLHNRKAKKRGNGGTHTGKEAEDLLIKQKYICVYCPQKLKENNRHKDHIIPLALGGTNNIDNIQWLCPKCNLSKGAKHPIDWAQEQGKLL